MGECFFYIAHTHPLGGIDVHFGGFNLLLIHMSQAKIALFILLFYFNI